MADIVDWPLNTLYPSSIGLDFAWNSRDGGAGFNGVTQIASPLTGLWEMSITLGAINMGESYLRAYRALKMRSKGRYGWIRFPIFDPYRVRFADAGWPEAAPTPGIPFSDGSFFSDGSGFASPDIRTTVVTAGELGDEEIAVNVASIGDALGIGHWISVNDYLHLIVSRGLRTGSGRVFGIGPPLRADIEDGDVVKIGRPTFLCRLADDRSGSVRLNVGRFGEPSIDFIEVLERE